MDSRKLLSKLTLLVLAASQAQFGLASPVVVTSARPTFGEQLAARELRRYLYVRTKTLVKIQTTPASGSSFVVGTLASEQVVSALGKQLVAQLESKLGPEGFSIQTIDKNRSRTIVIAGKSPSGTLRGAYRFAETLGVRFAPMGDILPDGKIPLKMPKLDVISNPVMPVRGYFPYTSGNPEGPEYWNKDDFMLFVGQQAKLGLNLIAMLQHHRGDGSLDITWTPSWDEPYKVARAPFGMAKAFGVEMYRSQNASLLPGAESKRKLSDLNTAMLRDVYRFGRSVGVDACMGGFINGGVDYWKKALTFLNSEGFAPTYLWQHTYENWTYTDPKEDLLASSVQGFKDFLTARNELRSPIKAVVSGWAIGPRKDPTLYDRELPKEVVMGPQILDIGRAPVDPAYGKMVDRPKWVVPWLEDDFNMIAPQLWVRRLIENVRDGRAYGASGLIATHWRTKVIEPQMIALSRLGWNGELDAEAFYLDYCLAAYGPEAGPDIAKLMSRLDGKLPRVTDWKEGWPGGIHVDREYWAKHQGDFAFVDELAALRAKVRGAGSLARFDYLLGQWTYMRAVGKLRSAMGTPAETEVAREAVTALLETVSGSSELGDLIFLNRQIPRGKPMDYTGKPHLIVSTPRTSLLNGESLRLKVDVLEAGLPKRVLFSWRRLGSGRWTTVALKPGTGAAASSYSVELPAAVLGGRDFEYRIVATTSKGKSLHFPATAPASGHTVVVVSGSLGS